MFLVDTARHQEPSCQKEKTVQDQAEIILFKEFKDLLGIWKEEKGTRRRSCDRNAAVIALAASCIVFIPFVNVIVREINGQFLVTGGPFNF